MSAFIQTPKSSIPNSTSVEELIIENIINNQANIQLGENGRVGYKTTGSSCLDMFTILSRGSESEKIIKTFKAVTSKYIKLYNFI